MKPSDLHAYPPILTPSHLAEILGMSTRGVSHRRRKGTLGVSPIHSVGTYPRYRRTDVAEYLFGAPAQRAADLAAYPPLIGKGDLAAILGISPTAFDSRRERGTLGIDPIDATAGRHHQWRTVDVERHLFGTKS